MTGAETNLRNSSLTLVHQLSYVRRGADHHPFVGPYLPESEMYLYFVGGIHGSGKTTLCQRLAISLKMLHYSAGELIRSEGVDQEEHQKSVRDVDLNQRLLLHALDRIRRSGVEGVFLDGHYTVVDTQGDICPIEVAVFRSLVPAAFVLVDTDPALVVDRLRRRDHKEYEISYVESHARAEKSHAEIVSEILQIPLLLWSDFEDADELARRLISPNATYQGAL